jgi:hypothetical protein
MITRIDAPTLRHINELALQAVRAAIEPLGVTVNWVDSPCWYCSVQDAGRTALVLGPFPTEASCREWAYRDEADGGSSKHTQLVNAACERDVKAWFYAWGMVKTQNGYSSGIFMGSFPDAEKDAIRAVPGRLDVAS